MRTNKNTRAFVVGIFVFLGLAIFLVTVLTLGGERKTFTKSITITALFDDVSGLQKGNNIWFSGVKIGTVKKITINNASQVAVEMNIDDASKQFIQKNARAKIGSEGLIGNRIVVITSGGGKSPMVEDGDVIGVDKVTNTDEMMNTFQSNNRNLLDITNDFKSISKNVLEGKGTVGKLLSDETLFNEFQLTIAMLKKSATNAQQLSTDVEQFTGKLNKKGALLNDVVTDTIVFHRLQTAVADIENVTKTANDIVADLKNTSTGLNTDLNNPKAPAGMFLKDEATAAQLKDVLKNLQSASIKLNEDLEAAQHNFFLKGFFKKKAKREADSLKALNNSQ
jgi:phospholipid/cholesterol/gamma-HCH transport system substrate-binding protein